MLFAGGKGFDGFGIILGLVGELESTRCVIFGFNLDFTACDLVGERYC